MIHRFLIIVSLFVFFTGGFLSAQTMNEMIDLQHYAQENSRLPFPQKGEKRVVFMGNSITEGWKKSHPAFFSENGFICRGISGQTTTQMLLRFRQDVINLHPVIVLINAGTNDIAENTGIYNPEFTFGNIRSMAELAQANGIVPILSSVLPVKQYWWNEKLIDVPQKIDALNNEIKRYAQEKGFAYIDYNSKMKTTDGALLPSLANDGVHPNAVGYELMESIAQPVIISVLGKVGEK